MLERKGVVSRDFLWGRGNEKEVFYCSLHISVHCQARWVRTHYRRAQKSHANVRLKIKSRLSFDSLVCWNFCFSDCHAHLTYLSVVQMISSALSAQVKSFFQIGVPLKNQSGHTSCVLLPLSWECHDQQVWQNSASTWLKTRNKNPDITTCHTLRFCLSAPQGHRGACRVKFTFSLFILSNFTFKITLIDLSTSKDIRVGPQGYLLTCSSCSLFLCQCVTPLESEDTQSLTVREVELLFLSHYLIGLVFILPLSCSTVQRHPC